MGAATFTVFKAHFGQHCAWQVPLLEAVIALGVITGASLAHGQQMGQLSVARKLQELDISLHIVSHWPKS